MLEFEVNQILLHMAVRPLTLIAQEGTFMASKGEVKLITRWPEDFFDYDFFGVLSLRSRDFNYFLCDSERFIGVNFDFLLELLGSMARDPLYELEGDELIGFCAQDYEQWAEISFRNIRNGTHNSREINFLNPQIAAVGEYLRESPREYCVVAAIPSWFFRSIIRLFHFGYEVTITITETQVCFSEPSLNVQVFLQTELSQCIIGATSVEDYPAQVTMYIGCATPFVLASYLSNLVWILHCDDPGALHLFNIPVGRTGNFMFYIP